MASKETNKATFRKSAASSPLHKPLASRQHVVFSPASQVTADGIFGIDGRYIFLLAEVFEILVREITSKCHEGTQAESLRGLYGHL
ncbi:hypothetical protein EDF78_11954 [Rahnella sp. BIGb0236]|nr:hypothetical protein EDF78_11954 [Rahnella sp. BIGb0236]